MLPAWLGAHKGLQQAIDDGQKSVLDEMSRQWPFFRTRLGDAGDGVPQGRPLAGGIL